MGTLTLVDADMMTHSCGWAVEKAKYMVWERGSEEFGPVEVFDKKKDIPAEFLDAPTLYIEKRRDLEPLENCLQLVKQMVCKILKATSATDYRIYIKGKGNFRDEVGVTRKYKGNRDPLHRPTYEQDIRLYLKQVWGAREVDGYEVDDQVCMDQWDGFRKHGHWDSTIIASPDKDLLQVPGNLYNYNNGVVYRVTELGAARAFYMQMLSGDSSDNIVGIEGIGKKGAEKLLKDCTTAKEMWEVVFEQYHKAYGERASDMLCEQGRLLYLLRHPNDKWEPPSAKQEKAA